MEKKYDWYHHNMLFADDLEKKMEEFYKDKPYTEKKMNVVHNMMDTYRKLNTDKALKEMHTIQQVFVLS